MEQFSRIERMVGSSWVEQLQNKKVAVFGLGGVGSYVVEALARGGVGALVLVDHDIVDITIPIPSLYSNGLGTIASGYIFFTGTIFRNGYISNPGTPYGVVTYQIIFHF